MMAPISWLPISAAATRIGCTVEQIQQMADAGFLHAKWLYDDHRSITEKSVKARVEWAAELAPKHRTTTAFLHRLALYAQLRRAGADSWAAATALGVDPFESICRYERWLVELGSELDPTPHAELATPSGDVLAAADDEDAMSAHLAAEQPAPSYRGGPPLDIHTEAEYELGKNT